MYNQKQFWTRLLLRVLLLTILDLIIIWNYVKWENPAPDAGIGILIVVPFVMIVNLVIAAILHVLKCQNAIVFIINAVISAIIMYNLFIAGIERRLHLEYEAWLFKVGDTAFIVRFQKPDNLFSVDGMDDKHIPPESWDYLHGRFTDNKDYYLLKTETNEEYTIKDDFLFGFRNIDKIKLTKVEY